MARPPSQFTTAVLLTATCCLFSAGDEYQRRVNVQEPTRLDWTYAVAKQSYVGTPPSWTFHGYDSTKQSYEFFGPRKSSQRDTAKRPLILFISPKSKAIGWKHWEPICRRYGFLYAGAIETHKGSHHNRRMRIVMDILHDVRALHSIDPHRTYIAGFYGGASIGTKLAYHLPEYFGGVVSIAGASGLPAEAWIRQPIVDKLSVVSVVGSVDSPGRGNQRIGLVQSQHRELQNASVRSQILSYPGQVHILPGPTPLHKAIRWLEQDLPRRRALAEEYPSTSQTLPLDRHSHSQAMLADAMKKREIASEAYPAWLTLTAIQKRWPDLDAGRIANQELNEMEDQAGDWKQQRDADSQAKLDQELATQRGSRELDSPRGSFTFPQEHGDLKNWISTNVMNVDLVNSPYDKTAQSALRRLDWRVGFNDDQHVNYVDLSGTRLSTKELLHFKQQLQGMHQLEAFDLSNMVMRESSLRHIADLTQLRALNLSFSDFTNQGMTYLSEMESLEFLALANTKLNSNGLTKLPSFRSLKCLHLGGTSVDSKALSAISDAAELLVLSLANTNITNEIAPDLSTLLHLEYLDLSSTKIGDVTCTSLVKMEQLKQLVLSHTRITNGAMASLAGLVNLEELDLLRTKVGDKGIRELHGMTQLRRLNVRGTQVSAEQIAAVKKAIPGISIQWNGNRFTSAAQKRRRLLQEREQSK